MSESSTAEPINPLKEQLARVIRIRKFSQVDQIGAFANYYFGHIDDPIYQEWDQLVFNHNRVMIECPLGHGKSWRISFTHPIWEIVYNRNRRMLITSKKAERAVEFGERISAELERNPKINFDFGDWVTVKQALGQPIDDADHTVKGFVDPKNWTKAKFTVLRPKIFREPTVVTSGVGGQIEGLRLDDIIMDDVEDIEDRTSEVEREAKKEWLRSTLLGRLEPDGKIRGIGTPWHQDDMYAYLEHLAELVQTGWRFRRYQALPNWDGDPTKPIRPLLPWRWTWEQLMAKYYEIGAVEFQAKYQCNPRASEGHWFKEKWLRYFDYDRLPKMRDIVMGCDFNLSDRSIEDNDYTALVVMGVDMKGDFYVLDIFREQLTDGHAIEIAKMYDRWKPHRIAVESTLFQRLIFKQVRATRPDLPTIPIESTQQKAQRILRLQPFFQQGRIFLRNDLLRLINFVNEYSAFPDGKHDDMLDAMQMCFELLGYSNPEWGGYEQGIQVLGGVSQYFGGGADVVV